MADARLAPYFCQVCLFFCSCGSKSKRYNRAIAEPRTKKKTIGEGERRFSPLPLPSPIVFCFNLGAAFVPLLLFEPKKKTPSPAQKKKKPPGTQATLYPSWKLWRDFIPKYQVEIREGVSLPLVVSWYVGLLQETKQCERSKSKKEYRRRHRQPV